VTSATRDRAGVLALLAAIVLHWVLFFGWVWGPRLSFQRNDWPKEYRYYSVLQQAVAHARVPYVLSKPVQETRKFLAIPETTWSPQVVLLGVLGIDAFVTANVVLLAALGFAGCIALRRRHAMGLLPFALLVVLMGVNGHLTAHLAVGHSMWVGHFLLSAFALAVLALVDGDRRAPVGVGLVAFAVLLQGDVHLYVWCAMLVGLLALFRRRLFRPCAEALLWCAALGVFRLASAAWVLLGRRDPEFFSGYASLADLAAGLVSLRDAGYPRRGGAFLALNWWEYDAYIGPAGLAFVLAYGIGARLVSRARALFAGLEYAALDGPLLVLAVLSYGDLYAPVKASGLPLLGAERVSSRFLILPLTFLVVLACARFSRVWSAVAPGARRTLLGAAMLVAVAGPIARHSALWSIPALERTAVEPEKARDLEITLVPPAPEDARYVRIARASFAFSALALCAAAWRLRRAAQL
jgi:hypothetical protein